MRGRAELSATPVRVRKDGVWQPVDTTPIKQDGVINPKAAKGDSTLSAGGDATLVKVSGGPAAISAPVPLPPPQPGSCTVIPSSSGSRPDDPPKRMAPIPGRN